MKKRISEYFFKEFRLFMSLKNSSNKLRIAIDVRQMYGRRGGVGVYLTNLINKLNKIDNTNEYLFFYEKIEEKRYESKLRNFFIPFFIDFFHKQLILPLILKFKKVDILFCPQHPIPFFFFNNTVVQIHDVPEDFEVSSPLIWIIRYLILPLTVKRAKLIVTDSEFSKKMIVNKLGVPENKIRVVYHSINENRFRLKENITRISEFKKKYYLKEKVILTVASSFAPRKNIQTLVKAFDLLPKKLKTSTSLFIVGKSEGWDMIKEKLRREVDFATLDSIILSGHIPDEELSLSYAASDVFVFTSFHEGFGLPVLEAMYYGLPVISSNSSSLPEVYGNAGIGIDPSDVYNFAKNIEKVLLDVKFSEKLQERSLERSKLFSSENMANQILNIFNEVCYHDRIK